MLGLYNNQGRGRKPKLNDEQKRQVKTWAKKEPKALLRVADQVKKEWGINISKETVKRIIKKLEMKWKRMKRGLSKEPDEWELEVKIPVLTDLIKQEKKREIDLRYLDQSGFSLTPYKCLNTINYTFDLLFSLFPLPFPRS
jgi:hypothetical protein